MVNLSLVTTSSMEFTPTFTLGFKIATTVHWIFSSSMVLAPGNSSLKGHLILTCDEPGA
jgi:hypothetical protein